MRSIILALVLGAVSISSYAKDPLDGTLWRTIDDKTGKPRAAVQFTETNGTLSATVKALLDKNARTHCEDCTGSLKGASVVGLKIVNNLKPVQGEPNSYDSGTILDPYNGKTYRLKGTLSADAKTLNLRGFIGISLLGRNQTWQRAE